MLHRQLSPVKEVDPVTNKKPRWYLRLANPPEVVERHHKFSKHLAFGSGGHLRSNNPADQEKAIVYNELVTNAVALQNVVDQTQALNMLKAEGISIRPAELAFLSPYATSKLKRFGDYPTDLKPEGMPTRMTFPL